MDCPVCKNKLTNSHGYEVDGQVLRVRVCKGCYTPVQTMELIVCAECGSLKTIRSSKTEDYGDVVSRYRKCLVCGTTFRSYESFSQIGEINGDETV